MNNDTITPGHNALADLAGRINAEHEAVREYLGRALERAIHAGALLTEAKGALPHGAWLPWLAEHCPDVRERTASHYMRLASYAPEIASAAAENGKTLADLSVTDALNLLRVVERGENMRAFLTSLAVINPRIEMSPVGVTFPDDLTKEQWLAVGHLLQEHFGAAIRATAEH
jgi:Protein of unknown function (DUF3102)